MTTASPQSIRHGYGILEFSSVAGRTVVTRAEAYNPLKWLVPRRSVSAAWGFATTFGGGLVAGDRIEMQVGVGPGARAVLATQSSTKVYRSDTDADCTQILGATVGRDGLMVVAPDPVTCFRGARYSQKQIIRLHPDATLVYVDWLTSGRRARGECWAFSRYRTRLDLYRAGERYLTDSLLLDPDDGPLDSPFRMGPFHCFAMMVMCGPQTQEAVVSLLEEVGNQEIRPVDEVVDSVSSLKDGAIWRIAGRTTEQVARRLKSRLEFLTPILGESPWNRKW
ncbi:MAG: urease accessory protein UreD [Fuerstiella sp.]|nr:urease accessory protein UreD [Fuerstiella sp.]